MPVKRSRAAFEADLIAQQSPFVVFGTPLPPKDPDVRDDGSYVPVWKQEVRDERGLKRLHGAFTGGFSAGYYNTVGSKEGWTPSTFVSSRTNRVKGTSKVEQRPEDFMDAEDIADAEDAKRVQTADGFAGIGSTEEDTTRVRTFVNVFRIQGETMGVKLLKKMGWKEGQGVGPKVRRKPDLGGHETTTDDTQAMQLFAPKNVPMIHLVRKTDHKGVGFEGESKLSTAHSSLPGDVELDEDDGIPTSIHAMRKTTKTKKPVRGGIGIGILNDTGSDDENPYEIGPRISYHRVIGGDKKKKTKKQSIEIANPSLNSKPVFISQKSTLAKASARLRKCHDGRLPLDGFVLSIPDAPSSSTFSPPNIPSDWKSAKTPNQLSRPTTYSSLTSAARASKLDPKSRASILGEAALPGKSVFDFLSPAARDRLASASGNTNLPPALSEVPAGYSLSKEEKAKNLLSQVPKIEKIVADAALSRGASGFMPYGDNELKRTRYRVYLENQAGTHPSLPEVPSNTSNEEWLKELQEFASCAQIFKPITGTMATRFTSSSAAPIASSNPSESNSGDSLLSKPPPKVKDPAEQAAELGMYGPMTRSSKSWFPTRLLCKRFNVRPPAHVQPGPNEQPNEEPGAPRNMASDLVSKATIDDMMRESRVKNPQWAISNEAEEPEKPEDSTKANDFVVDAERNEALEGQKAGEAVFKAIFGDDSDDDEEE